MLNKITQLHNLEPKEILTPIEELKKSIEDLKNNYQPKDTTEYLTRKEVAELLKVDLSTIHNWCKSGKLLPYGIGKRVYFKREDLERSIIPLNK